jgi:arsenate reductase
MLLPEIKNYISEAIKSFDTIPEERKEVLKKIGQYVQKRISEGKTAELIYVCTHNSRRSHFGQIWGKTAAAYYGFENVNTYSAGTEATAFNPNAIRAAREAGFKIIQEGESNPHYSVFYDEQKSSILCFSKTFLDTSIPKEGLCAVMTCTEADGNCPFIPGTEVRISCPYVDPKAFDGTPQQDEKYQERCKQIATESLYVFSNVKI